MMDKGVVAFRLCRNQPLISGGLAAATIIGKGAERYTDNPRDLWKVRNMDTFYERLRECMYNCKRLIKKRG